MGNNRIWGLWGLLLVCCLAVIWPARAEAATIVASGTCGAEDDGSNVTWTLDDAGTLTISGTGAMADYSYPDYAPWYDTREDVTVVIINSGVISIGSYAFEDCDGLTSVTIPSSVIEIGRSAFYSCGRLTSVAIPSGVTRISNGAFHDCDSLTSVTIPSGATRIENYAFSGCSSLTSVTIPSGVTEIGDGAFEHCTSLTSVMIPSGVTEIGNNPFADCRSLANIAVDEPNQYYRIEDGILYNDDQSVLVCCLSTRSGAVSIPSSVAEIGESAFRGCSNLTSVTIPDSVIEIGDWAFSGCSGLTSVTIPSNVTEIGYRTFNRCSSLTDVTIPDSVIKIGDSAFHSCDSLTNVMIPGSVAEIDNSAFCFCISLTSATIPESVTYIGDGAFSRCSSLTSITVEEPNRFFSSEDGVLYNDDKTTLICCPGRKDGAFTIPTSVTEISHYAFEHCSSLTSVVIPSGVIEIGYDTFWGCNSLTSITIPDGVTKIDHAAFYGCTGLTSVTIPVSVSEIGDQAFYACDGLRDVYYSGSETDWAEIDIRDVNEELTSANIHYNSTGPEPEENDTIKYTGISEDGLLVEVEIEPGAASDNTVFCAFFAESGQMLSVQSKTPDSELRFAIDTRAVRARLFVLDENSVPQCASVSVLLP